MTIYMGIDWSQKKHDVCALNEKGEVIARLTFPHTQNGFHQLDKFRQKLAASVAECQIGIETAHTILIDFLWSRGYENLFVLAPSAVKSARKRYGQSRAKNDRRDAYIIGDMVRTDQQRLQPWRPHSPLIQQIKAQVRLIQYQTKTMVAASNRLRATLFRYYPVATKIFSNPMPPIAWHFVLEYPTPEAATALSWDAFRLFARRCRHRQSDATLRRCYARLQTAEVIAQPQVVLAYQAEAVLLAGQLLQFDQSKKAQLKSLTTLFSQHPDAPLFRSLPGAGPFLAPTLLSKFGDDRGRFPTPASLQTLAGTCPVTNQSGQKRRVLFRTACDRPFRQIVMQWAQSSLASSTWANMYFEQRHSPHRSYNHALRCLANRWLAIAWKVWQSGNPYDEAFHLQQRKNRLLSHR